MIAYGKFKDVTLNLKDGLNLIGGDNEAGKSTVMAFIRHMLFGFPANSRGELSASNRKKYTPWSGERMAGELTFTHAGKQYAIKRTAGTSRAKDEYSLIDLETNQEADLSIPELLSVGEEGYLNTAFIPQLSSRITSSGEVTAALLNLAGSGKEDTSVEEGIKILKGMASDLRKRSGNGVLQVAEEKKRTLLRNLSAAREQYAKEAQNEALRKEKERRLDEVIKAVKALSETIEQAEKSAVYQEYLALNEEAKREETRLSALHEEEAELQEKAKGYEAFETPVSFAAEESTETVDWQLDDLAGKKTLSRILLFTGVGVALVAFVLGFLFTPVSFVGAGAGMILLACAFLWGRSIAGKEARFTAIKAEKEEKNQKRVATLRTYGCETVEEYNQKRARRQELVTRLEECAKRISAQEEQQKEAQRRMGAKEREIIQKYGKVEDFRPVFITGNPLREKEQLEAERLALSTEIGRLTPKEGEPAVSPSEIEAEIQELDETIEAYQKKEQAISIAMDAIQKAHGELSRDFAPKVNERASEILAALSGGAHPSVAMNKDYEVRLGMGEGSQVEYMSSGTADQVYLALRLAISELIFAGKEVPLILDDPFTQYDITREKEAMWFLHEYAKEKQVILFTARPAEEPTVRL